MENAEGFSRAGNSWIESAAQGSVGSRDDGVSVVKFDGEIVSGALRFDLKETSSRKSGSIAL